MKHIAELIAHWRRHRQSIRDLSWLTDRELADIGLNRYEIESASLVTFLIEVIGKGLKRAADGTVLKLIRGAQ